MSDSIIPPNVNLELAPFNPKFIGTTNFDTPPLTIDLGRGTNRPQGTTTAFVWSCQEWVNTGEDPIVMLINPSQVRWSVPFRVTKTNTFGGTIFHRWKNLSGSSVDLPTLSITMNTGTLYPITFFSGNPELNRAQMSQTPINPTPVVNKTQFFAGEDTGGAVTKDVKMRNLSQDEKVNIFYKFIRLTHQKAFTTSGEPNLIFLSYRTLLFPNVYMYLQFIEPLQFTEDAMKPFNVEYTIGAVVVKMLPQLDSTDLLNSRDLVGVGMPPL